MQKVKVFKSGMRLIVENMPNYESVSFNVFVNVGSTNEDNTNRGISHFIEHMLFKGTKNRSAAEIVTRLDAIGARVNAYTSKKETVYFTKSTKAALNECVDILSDMYFNSTFGQKEIGQEKKVIIEEIKMYRDNASSVAYELAMSSFYKGTPLQYSIAGTKTSIRAMTREKIMDYLKKHYTPENLILSFAGNITMEEAEEIAMKFFESKFKTASKPAIIKTPEILTIPKTAFVKKFKDNEQAQIGICFPAINLHDDRHYALTLFNIIWGVGGNMSTRLFQTIREKLGLVYSIYSSVETSNYGGDLSIYLATSTANIKVAVGALKKAIDTVAEDGITQQELTDAKTNLINTLKLQYENTAYVSLFNVKMLANHGFVRSKEARIEKYKKITIDEINEIAKTVYSSNNYVISMVGKDIKTNLLKYFK